MRVLLTEFLTLENWVVELIVNLVVILKEILVLIDDGRIHGFKCPSVEENNEGVIKIGDGSAANDQ